ncbi:hypothetical protein HYALB_00002859 [Hymenoscyphus albidus]|uniref:Uncharacterized protein n=1 Tax=Hymenoscyphus albidus TaxID=595503 RepID=A0A9N9LGX3_9HELO|nr:hypothetical protein HYALB_00002859 [Hymenoscyphus albidus]
MTLEVTKGSQGLVLAFDQWGVQDGRITDRATLSSSREETAYAALYWPENLTRTTVIATFDSCKCIGIGIQGGHIWTSRSISNLIQSPRPLIDCSISRKYQANWCLRSFNCIISDIQLSTNPKNLAIDQISFKAIDGSVRSIGRHISSHLQLSFPLSCKFGEALSQIRVCHSSEKSFITIQFVTSFNRVIMVGNVPENALWSSVDWPSSIYATYEFNKTGFCLFGIDSQLPLITSTGTSRSDFSVPSTLPPTHYATASRFDRTITLVQAPLYQVTCLKVFQHHTPHMLRSGAYVSYICGIQLFYANGLSIILGQLGEGSKIQVASTITELKVWIFQDEEYVQIRGLEFHFGTGADFQAVCQGTAFKKSLLNTPLRSSSTFQREIGQTHDEVD